MTLFRYTARDQLGSMKAGEIDAESADAARQWLQTQGLVMETFVSDAAADSTAAPRPAASPLSADEAEQLTHRVSRLSAAQLPLGDGLRAAAAETSSHRLAVMLRELADESDRGRSIDQALEDRRTLLPGHVQGLLRAAQRTGQLGHALFHVVELHHNLRALRNEVFAAFAYPALVLTLAAIIVVTTLLTIVGDFELMFTEFELKLPLATLLLFWWRREGLWLLLFGLVLLATGIVLVRWSISRPAWRRLIWAMPVLGEFWQWTAVAEFSRLLSMLLTYRVPLPESLRLVAEAARDKYLAQLCGKMAASIEAGRPFSTVLTEVGRFPDSLTPLIRWGECGDRLPEAFATVAAVFEERVRIRTVLLRSILPPAVYVVVGGFIAIVAIALFSPLLDLISKLSGG